MIGLHLTTQGSSVLGNPPGRNIPGSAHSTRYVKPEYSGTRMTRVNILNLNSQKITDEEPWLLMGQKTEFEY